MVFGLYIHVPFCSTRCGYCDFNTYIPRTLSKEAQPIAYLDAVEKELTYAGEYVHHRCVNTVFLGGGTPSELGAAGLVRILDAVRHNFPLAPDAEITTEANPESTSPHFFDALRAAGYTRISLGMQSAAEHVLATLGRVHTPGRAARAAREAKEAGFTHVNLDMIYGTPGETREDIDRTLETILGTGVDHVSAYSLIVEKGTAMARRIARGELEAPDDDALATCYEHIAHRLEKEGFAWYEVSNWARPGGECKHNLGYWRNDEWWGAGPGAHSHIAGRRFSHVKHPARYTQMLAAGELPIATSEILNTEDRHTESIMLGLRLAEGIPLSWITPGGRNVVRRYVDSGLLELSTTREVRIAPTRSGRLLIDGIIADILVAEDEASHSN